MLVVPNAVCVAGVFALGWGVMASVVLNNISALAALANGLIPMRRAMALERVRTARQRPAGSPLAQKTPTGSHASPRLRVVEDSVDFPPKTHSPDGRPLPAPRDGFRPRLIQHNTPQH